MKQLDIVDFGPKSSEDSDKILKHIHHYINQNQIQELKILEAGCGQRWELKITDAPYKLVGVDSSKEALDLRLNVQKDLDEAIHGDLRNVNFEPESLDIIYTSYVMEHVDGAETVLNNFHRWLKPNGLIVMRIPDAATGYGFWAKHTPFFMHVWYKKYVKKEKNAGKPGYDPFPTFYDPVVSLTGMRKYCREKKLSILDEYSYRFSAQRISFLFAYLPIKLVEVLSFGSISSKRSDLLYVLKKQL